MIDRYENLAEADSFKEEVIYREPLVQRKPQEINGSDSELKQRP
jgi:hypothetical protein